MAGQKKNNGAMYADPVQNGSLSLVNKWLLDDWSTLSGCHFWTGSR